MWKKPANNFLQASAAQRIEGLEWPIIGQTIHHTQHMETLPPFPEFARDPWRDVKDCHSCTEDLETSLYPFTDYFLALTPSYSHNKYLAQKSNGETHLSFASCFLSWPPFNKSSSLCWRLLPQYLVFPLPSGQWNHLLGYNSNNELGI